MTNPAGTPRIIASESVEPKSPRRQKPKLDTNTPMTPRTRNRQPLRESHDDQSSPSTEPPKGLKRKRK